MNTRSMHVLKARASAFYLLGPSAWLFFKDYAIKLKSIAYNLYSINGLCAIGTFLSLCKFELLILSTSIMTIKRLTLEPATMKQVTIWNLKVSLHFGKLAHYLTLTLFFRNIWSKSSLYLNLHAMHQNTITTYLPMLALEALTLLNNICKLCTTVSNWL